MGYKIFLSHSDCDQAWADGVALQARASGVEVYLFAHDVILGESIAERVKSKIRESDSVLVLLTANSHSSPYVQQEIGFAEASNKLVIPLVAPGVPESSLGMLNGRANLAFDPTKPDIALQKLGMYLSQLKVRKEVVWAVITVIALGGLIWFVYHTTKD